MSGIYHRKINIASYVSLNIIFPIVKAGFITLKQLNQSHEVEKYGVRTDLTMPKESLVKVLNYKHFKDN